MTRMFTIDGKVVKTWNPIIGCQHRCSYCYARDLAEGKLSSTPKYAEGFKPKLWEPALKSRFHQSTVFVSDMGDMWGKRVPLEWVEKVLRVVRESPKATFLMLTKNPAKYYLFLRRMPPNVVLGATIESNLAYPEISNAPPMGNRIMAMRKLPREFRRFVSIEPVMDFNGADFPWLIEHIAPAFVYIGYDNHNHHLPEPPIAKTLELIAALSQFTEVRGKTIRKAWNEA